MKRRQKGVIEASGQTLRGGKPPVLAARAPDALPQHSKNRAPRSSTPKEVCERGKSSSNSTVATPTSDSAEDYKAAAPARSSTTESARRRQTAGQSPPTLASSVPSPPSPPTRVGETPLTYRILLGRAPPHMQLPGTSFFTPSGSPSPPRTTPTTAEESVPPVMASTAAATSPPCEYATYLQPISQGEHDVGQWLLYAPCAQAEKDLYHEGWTQVVRGATSGIMFVLVVSLGYALYLLSAPYRGSITTAALFSIVLHPRNRAASSVHLHTCLRRMARVQQEWRARGRLLGLVGCWVSLQSFVSFMLMQCAVLLGLSKIRVSSAAAVKLAESLEAGAERSKVSAASKQGHAKSSKGSKSIQTDGHSSHKGMPHDRHTPRETAASTARSVPLASTRLGRHLLRALTVVILLALSHFLVGVRYFIVLHAILLGVAATCVCVLKEQTFVVVMRRLWRTALVAFFVCGLLHSFAQDVLSISSTLRKTTTAVVLRGNGENRLDRAVSPTPARDTADSAGMYAAVGAVVPEVDTPDATGREEDSLNGAADDLLRQLYDEVRRFGVPKLQERVLAGLGELFNQTNATELAAEIMEWVSPWMTTAEGAQKGPLGTAFIHARSPIKAATNRSLLRGLFSLPFNYTPKSSTVVADGYPRAGSGSAMASVGWLQLAQRLSFLLRPCVEYSARLLVHLAVNLINFFDSIYAAILFVCTYRYLTTLNHTVLYYAIAKLLRPIHAELGEYHADNIERDITTSFASLLQSFWHLSWFHFSITFCTFRLWSLPTPFLFGLTAVMLALFPLVPKWLSPCSLAFAVHAFRCVDEKGLLVALVSPSVLSMLLAVVMEYSDEWLLCVSRGVRGGSVTDAAGKEREELPPFVVGTALVLGFVAYGTRGIVFGPLTVIVAKVFFDNWDISVCARDAPRAAAALCAETAPVSSSKRVSDRLDSEEQVQASPPPSGRARPPRT